MDICEYVAAGCLDSLASSCGKSKARSMACTESAEQLCRWRHRREWHISKFRGSGQHTDTDTAYSFVVFLLLDKLQAWMASHEMVARSTKQDHTGKIGFF